MTTARAPASSANLGPGFDVLALALDLPMFVTMTADDSWSGSELAPSGLEMVRAAAELAVPGLGPQRVSVSGDVPPARGLGSSAALRVAAVALAIDSAGEPFDRDRVFEIAAEAEGHPDNVAAATYGGLVAVSSEGSVHRLDLHPSLAPVIAVPTAVLSTRDARGALADTVARDVVSRSIGRALLLVEGLRSGDAEALRAARGDELHESPRASLSPLTGSLIDAAYESGAEFAAWSGAGPSALAFVTEDSEESVRSVWEEILGPDGEVVAPGVSWRGVTID